MRFKFIVLIVLIIQTPKCFAQFSNPTIIDSNFELNIRNITSHDINNDGLEDLIVSSYQSDIFLFLNNGKGFSEKSLLSSEITTPYHLDLGDVDLDGQPDILVTNNHGNNSGAILLINNGSDLDWEKRVIESNLEIGAFKSFFIDVENDGDLDIVINGDTSICLYKNDGLGNFPNRVVIEEMDEYYSICIGDFNNDNFDDLIVNSGNSGTKIFSNMGNGNFATSSAIIFGLSIYLDALDFNNDNNLDIVRGGSSSINQLELYRNDSSQFTLYQLGDFGFANDVTNSKTVFADLDQDGFKDLLFIKGSSIFWSRNDQTGIFENDEMINDNYLFNIIYSMDIDDDSDNDIVWAGLNSENQFILGYILNQSIVGINEVSSPTTFKFDTTTSNNEMSIVSNKEISKLKLFNSSGQIIRSTNRNSINIENLVNGVYFIQIDIENYTNVGVVKFIKI